MLGTLPADVIVRLIITLWFCGFYWRLSRISEYRLYKDIEWKKTDVGPVEKYYLIGMGIFGGTVYGIFTWGILKTLIPNSLDFAIVSGVLNGFIFMLQIVTHYWVLKV